ncbi:MAG: lipid-binding SYLF domain-containing protein [Candidatus Omnitrophica bacterium]|nr:lipid-binding SYLF domain-containing protein [Candidatus Omnitrophota bacterium]
MKKIRVLLSAILIFAALFYANSTLADEELNSLINDCAIVFEEVTEMPEKGIPENLLKDATGIAIFPSTIKGAFFLGGRYGEGVVSYRDSKTKKWSPPAFFTVKGLSFGWQVGGQAIDLIFVIPTERGFEGMLANKLNIGTNTALVAGPIGRNMEMGADIMLKGGIFTYSRAKGLFAGMGLKGLSIDEDKGANALYYGKELSARDILINSKVKATPKGKELIDTFTKHTK